MMLHGIKHSISNKLMLVVMATTFIALLTYGVVMLAYDLRAYHESVLGDLITQANIIAEVSTPALEFDDPNTAKQNLELLRTRPSILRAAIYAEDRTRFAEYASGAEPKIKWPEVPQKVDDYTIEGNSIEVWQRIVKNGQVLGAVYISARYSVQERLFNYTIILIGVMGASFGLATLVAIWLRGAVTKPIFAVTNVARQVMQSRDFSLRAKKFTEDEIGVLADAVNDMLSEVGRRAKALEESNRFLEYEMAERQAAEDALRLADRRKDEFLATLAHELRNPLAPLINGLSILRLSKKSPETLEAAQAVMERQLKQMVRLVDDLLDVSRITTGKLTIVKTRVAIQSVMSDALETSGAFIDAHNHHVTVKMPPDPVYVDADDIRLAQVFSNLLNNSAKYTNRGGSITFVAQVEGEDIVVSVTDNGIGIASNMLNDIFEMFTQADQSLERTNAGLGVGLALSKHLVELHGGTLCAHSNGLGEGSSFSVRLRVASKQLNSTERPVNSGYTGDRRFRVMLVDDNVDFVTTMASLLTAMDYDVRTAHEGTRAQQIAREFAPEFAFMDIGMPGLNGYDLARCMRQIPETANSILIAVTGWGQEKDRQLSREAGFNHHLVKPVDLAQILAVLEAGPASAR